jgi:hypothetical protein
MQGVRRRYQANRGGHAPGHLRDAFLAWVDEIDFIEPAEVLPTFPVDGEDRDLLWLFGQLWNCTDVLPGGTVEKLEDMLGTRLNRRTYAAAVRELRPVFTG